MLLDQFPLADLLQGVLIDSPAHEFERHNSTDQTGNVVSRSIRVLYPAAVPTMQKYLVMDDFLVLMWMRQQPAMAEIAKDTRFAQFYAELKAGII
jgi:hypothetical protein